MNHILWMSGVKRLLLISLFCLSLISCGDGDEGDRSIPAVGMNYVLLAWNDLGMHCLNPTYDTLVVLPPYNTVWAQLVRRGSRPTLVTSGVTLEYTMVNNSSSVNKSSIAHSSDYGQFWTYAFNLFGVTLANDPGLTGNGLSGTMTPVGSHYEAVGIPVTPVDDSNVWNPYQVIEITVKDSSSGAVLAKTRATVPTSDEINCNRCHAPTGTITDSFNDILQKHDTAVGTTLISSTPVLCASCHDSPALGMSGGSASTYLSEAIHGFHAGKTTPEGAAVGCYDCHPGTSTKCNRSQAHTAADGNCVTCHGDMQNVATSITQGRIPWVTEPKCNSCHTGVSEVDTGTALYRNSLGHGGVNCAACHGSPHAMVPSNVSSDNYQALQYQGAALSLGSCAVCHSRSKGGGAGEFMGEHGGSGHPSACAVCHTTIPSGNTSLWPHRFEWKNR
jgi:hypothetical protein